MSLRAAHCCGSRHAIAKMLRAGPTAIACGLAQSGPAPRRPVWAMSILIEGFCAFATPVVGSGGSITLDLDRTLVLQMVLFMLLVVVLKPLLFDPVLRVFEQREQRTEGARAEARAMQERAGDLLREYDREVDGMRQTAAEERDRLRHETSRLEADILRKARDGSNRILEEGRKRIQDEVRSLETELLSRTPELATEITSSILGRRAQ